ncbi:MAG: hypothetical protein V3U63_09755 [Gemmatimonadota bacterium]
MIGLAFGLAQQPAHHVGEQLDFLLRGRTQRVLADPLADADRVGERDALGDDRADRLSRSP